MKQLSLINKTFSLPVGSSLCLLEVHVAFGVAFSIDNAAVNAVILSLHSALFPQEKRSGKCVSLLAQQSSICIGGGGGGGVGCLTSANLIF